MFVSFHSGIGEEKLGLLISCVTFRAVWDDKAVENSQKGRFIILPQTAKQYLLALLNVLFLCERSQVIQVNLWIGNVTPHPQRCPAFPHLSWCSECGANVFVELPDWGGEFRRQQRTRWPQMSRPQRQSLDLKHGLKRWLACCQPVHYHDQILLFLFSGMPGILWEICQRKTRWCPTLTKLSWFVFS